ncbi:MAG: polysaccharide deacetylase family protein [Thaumarchaeota archaeon]|nr:polysaccharide deacetylase family protein [Nitrososphaerota archaeon]
MKRTAKTLAVKGLGTPLGSNSFISRRVLRALKMDYGPFQRNPTYLNGKNSISCVSVDFDVTRPSRFEDNRNGTRALLGLAERYRMPLTWAVCGHSVEDDMRSYEAILQSPVPKEIGIHTYSHIDAQASSSESFKADVERCIQVLGLNDRPKTFIFPWNREAHFDVLHELGFRAYRGARRAICSPVETNGLWNIRPVYYVDQKSLGSADLIKSYLDLCIEHFAVFHLWLHPWSIMIDGQAEPMAQTLDEVFSYMQEKRNEGTLDFLTMGELAFRLDVASPKSRAQQERPQEVRSRPAENFGEATRGHGPVDLTLVDPSRGDEVRSSH